jgi:WD40 repeat protein
MMKGQAMISNKWIVAAFSLALCFSIAMPAEPLALSAQKTNQGKPSKVKPIPEPIQDPNHSEVTNIAYSKQLDLLASAPARYSSSKFQKIALPIYIWDLRTGKLLETLPGHGQRIQHLSFTGDEKHLVSSASDGVILWDVLKSTSERKRFNSIKTWATLVPSRNELIHCDDKVNLIVWDLTTGGKKSTFAGPRDVSESIAYPDELLR